MEIHLEITEPDRNAVALLQAQCDLSRQQIKQAMKKGAVWVTQGRNTRRLRRASKLLQPGSTLHLYYDEKVLAEIPPTPVLVADEGGYSIWFKPYGLRSQGSRWGDHCTINRWVEENLQPQRPAFVVHRLDRAATGLMIIAHTRKLAAAFAQLFHDRQVRKIYRVTVHGVIPPENLPLELDTMLDGKQALTRVLSCEPGAEPGVSKLEVQIETGRKHQIRRHLAEAGFPVLGDRQYGNRDDQCDLQLQAYELGFICPVSGEARVYRCPVNHDS